MTGPRAGTPDHDPQAWLVGDGIDLSERPTSHRERKKAMTRLQLVQVSQRLFAERGYAGTTLEDICAEVGIRPQTLLRYFESKAHLALAPMFEPIGVLRRALDDPGRDLDTLTLWREYMKLECREMMAPTSETVVRYVHNLRAFRTWGERDPVLIAMVCAIDHEIREILAAALARDRGVPDDDLHSTMVAALLVAGRGAVYERWLARDPEAGSLIDDQLAVIDYAVRSLPRRGARRLLSVAAG